MKLTISYHDSNNHIADSLSDPLALMLAAEDEQEEIEHMVDIQLGIKQHVTPKRGSETETDYKPQ